MNKNNFISDKIGLIYQCAISVNIDNCLREAGPDCLASLAR